MLASASILIVAQGLWHRGLRFRGGDGTGGLLGEHIPLHEPALGVVDSDLR